MKRSCLLSLLWVALLGGAAPVPAARGADDKAEAGADAFPLPEKYLSVGGASDYIAQAKAYLQDHPASPYAPRVALDLLMLGTARGNEGLVAEMRRTLLMDYGGSLQGGYLLGSFRDGGEYVHFLADTVAPNFDKPSPTFARRFDSALRSGVQRFGADVMGQGVYLLQCAALAGEAGDRELQSAAFARVGATSTRDGPAAKIGAALFDEALDPAAKVARLHALPDRLMAIPFERYLVSRMPPAQRDAPAVVKAQAENSLDAGNLAEALPLMEALEAGGGGGGGAVEPRLAFWHGWCEIAAGRSDAGLKRLADLAARSPADPWGGLAAGLLPEVRGLDKNVDASAAAVAQTASLWQKGPEQIELVIDTTADPSATAGPAAAPAATSLYLAWAVNQRFEAVLQRGGRVVLAYRAADKECRLYAEGDATIHQFKEAGPLPSPQVRVVRDPTGNFRIDGGLNLTRRSADVTAGLLKALDSKYLNTPEGVRELLQNVIIRRGTVPLPPATEKGVTTYAWAGPDTARPQLRRSEFRTASDGSLVGLRVGATELRQLRAGAVGSFAFAPPVWPDGKIVAHEQLDPAVVFRMMVAMSNAMGG